MREAIFGEIPGYAEGSHFNTREELSRAGVHRPRIAGISGRGADGADSVVLAGGYEDWEDLGAMILYTGHGGRDAESKRQIDHQMLTRGNLALATNKLTGLPVRLIRGAKLFSPYSPATGYRYDGLYQVVDYWRQQGRSGFFIWKFHLVKIPAALSTPAAVQLHTGYATEAARQVKALYHHHCQVCRIRLTGTAGFYAETVHLRPLITPHNGPDIVENIVCVCPNHRSLFDIGGVAIADDFSLLGYDGRLMVDFRHKINLEHVRYRREHYPIDPDTD
ncbi:MAG: YDG/SRA domain-containing protein [Candidatus Binatia bacterium]